MFITSIILPLLRFQEPVTIVMDNGEVNRLTELALYQTKTSFSTASIYYIESGRNQSIEINKLKRINIKELIGRNKGIQRWNVILVTKSNVKYDVELDLVEVVGQDMEGNQVAIAASTIDKITL